MSNTARYGLPQTGEVLLLTMVHADGPKAGMDWTSGLDCALYSARREHFRISETRLDVQLPVAQK
jgi:hypothetical protein